MENYMAFLKNKKSKKEKILIFSITNTIQAGICSGLNIDILRFSIDEFALLFGYKDIKRISKNDILPVIKNFDFTDSQNHFAIDIPITEIYGEKGYSLSKIIAFYKETRADFLIIPFYHASVELVKKLHEIQIPVILNLRNSFDLTERELKVLEHTLVEIDNAGTSAIIMEDFPANFTIHIRDTITIPVITNSLESAKDGYYAQYITAFGLFESEDKNYLNLYDLMKDATEDCVHEIKSNL